MKAYTSALPTGDSKLSQDVNQCANELQEAIKEVKFNDWLSSEQALMKIAKSFKKCMKDAISAYYDRSKKPVGQRDCIHKVIDGIPIEHIASANSCGAVTSFSRSLYHCFDIAYRALWRSDENGAGLAVRAPPPAILIGLGLMALNFPFT